MKTQKIKNLLNYSSKEESKFADQQQKANTRQAILLNLKQKLLNQVFVNIPMIYSSRRKCYSKCSQ